METKHCPKCNSDDLWYEFDIFKKRTDKDYHNGKVACHSCKHNFMKTDIKIRYWKEIIKK